MLDRRNPGDGAVSGRGESARALARPLALSPALARPPRTLAGRHPGHSGVSYTLVGKLMCVQHSHVDGDVCWTHAV
jgi:hypothetical protein